MRVAITTDSFREGLGGVATAVAALAHTLRAAGHTVRIFTAADPSHAALGLDVAGFPALHYERLPGGRVVVAPVGLARGLDAFRPDVIHNHSMAAMGTQALAAARLLDVPILSTCHVYLAGFLGYAPLPLDWIPGTDHAAWRYTAAFFNHFPLVTTPSQVMARELTAHGLRVPVVAVSNGVDIHLFRPGPQTSGKDGVMVLHVGRLSYEKNVDLLLRAFARVAERHPVARLTIAGDGPDRKALARLASELGLNERVCFTGFVPHEQLPALYQAADLFATASTIETQGLVVLEAMACGLPVAGVDALALPEAVHHTVNGFLAPAGNEAALAQHLARLVADASLRRRMGAASRRLAERHSLEQIVAQYERLYRQVAAAPPPPFPPAWMRRGGWLWGAMAGGMHLVRGLGGRIT
jgi:glycosyltransferase involved in cell wall biosynthesis